MNFARPSTRLSRAVSSSTLDETVVSSSLEGDKSKIRVAIIAGTFIPFAMFALWDAAVLGSVGVDDVEAALRQGVKAPDPLATLQASSDAAKALVSGFSFFAVSTSFLGFVLGLTDFLADGMKTTSKGDAKPWAVALLPPTAFALAYPDIFLSALDKAGTFGVLTLFGCMPPLMAWRNREMQRRESPPEECELRGDAFACVVTSDVLDPIVPGGIVALGALGTLALAVVVADAAMLDAAIGLDVRHEGGGDDGDGGAGARGWDGAGTPRHWEIEGRGGHFWYEQAGRR